MEADQKGGLCMFHFRFHLGNGWMDSQYQHYSSTINLLNIDLYGNSNIIGATDR